jgi:hypothetical protein
MPRIDVSHESTLARAAQAVTRVRDEIDELWHDSMQHDDAGAAERLVAVSHLIRNAHHLLDQARSIG